MNDSEAKEFLDGIEKAKNEAPTAHDKAAPEALLHFAKLLVKLSQEADATANKVLTLTHVLAWFTAVLPIVALVQVAIMVFEYRETHAKTIKTDHNYQTPSNK